MKGQNLSGLWIQMVSPEGANCVFPDIRPGIIVACHGEGGWGMRQTVSFITLGVRDLSRSRGFYQALGWTESLSSQESIAFFNVGTVIFGLFQRENLADDANIPSEGSGFPGFSLAHNVESEEAVVRTLNEAVAAGATLVRSAEKVFWGGFRGYFADLDGFLWEVCWNPFFPLDERGYVQLPS